MRSESAIHVGRDRFHGTWDPAIEPVVEVGSGDPVVLESTDASGGQLSPTSTADALAGLDLSRCNPITGPVRVAGAKAGDVLQVDLLEFEPASWGWTANIPPYSLLAGEMPRPWYRAVTIDGPEIAFLPGIRIPVAPFCGEIGVAPPERRPLGPPDTHGGNLDVRDLTAGATLFLPVFVDGANFSIGDGHAAQGDGEVSGTAVETAMRSTVRLTVRRDLSLAAPEFIAGPPAPARDDAPGGRYVTMGIGPDLLTAAREATRRMIDWLGREHGLGPDDAYLLCSVAVDLRISEIVDAPNHVVTAHCPLAIFG